MNIKELLPFQRHRKEIFMSNSDLQKFHKKAIKGGVTDVKLIHPSSVVTAPWVRFKCQFGCPFYGLSYCCPPDTPNHDQTRAVLDSYNRALLFHIELPDSEDRVKRSNKIHEMLVKMEGEVFKDGFYKAFILPIGLCTLCKECAKNEGKPCRLGDKARPSMEAVGIDVYQTARNNGFFINTLKEITETHNLYALLLVD